MTTPNQMAEALRLADAIDPFTRSAAPDHLTSKVAADTLRRLAAHDAQPSAELPEPFTPDWPEYHSEAMGCGLEDRGIRDRYEAMYYGWCCAIERAAEAIPDDLYTADQMHAFRAAGVAEFKADAERYREVRRGQHWSVIDGIGNDLRAEQLDAAIDAARKGGTT